jgi:ABC-type transport system involved in multi-copper enzyme maturation permease subunit
MHKEVFLIIKKEIIETIRSKRKLWPFVFTIIPILMFFYTKGSESLFPVDYAVYIIPIFIATLIAMQISSTSIINEKSTHMLDILLAMKIKPIVIVFAKNIFVALFAILISLIFILIMKIGSFYFLKEDLFILNFGYFIILPAITYSGSVTTFLISLTIREQSVIPMTSLFAFIIVFGPIYWLLNLYRIHVFESINLLFISMIIIVLDIILSQVGAYLLKKSKFIISI